tara:strand:+ start:143 stop:460 length:318 start_codon:yes stop_codon:yes gene_type:complete
MPDLTIKPNVGNGNKVIIQDQAGTPVLTTADNGTEITNISATVNPLTDNAIDLGSTAKRWRNIYTTDLHLNNDRGDWTIIEEEEYLSIRNNKNGKMYKFVLEEVE